MSEISNKFFADKAVGALWDVAVSIKRGNPLPLDKDSVVHGLAELEALKTGAVTYPGQIVAVIEDAVMEGDTIKTPETTTLYYFDHELNYHEVGKVPVGDEVSIEVKDEVISLRDFGKAYYKYYPESEENGETVAAHYEKVEVDTTNIWKAGLEPKVVNENGKMVLGWFEPNPTTIEGVNNQVIALRSDVDALNAAVGVEGDEDTESTGLYAIIEAIKGRVSINETDIADIEKVLNGVPSEGDSEAVKGLIERVDDAEGAIANKADKTYVDEELGKKANSQAMTEALALKANNSDLELKADKTYVDTELNKKAVATEVTEALALKANSADVYNKESVYTKAEVESYVSNQIGSAGHLKREIVEALPEVASADKDTIYMIEKKGGLLTQDMYEEYMVIQGAWEKIGDTYVDLSNYVTKDTFQPVSDKVTTIEENYVNKTTFEEGLALKSDKTYVDDELGKKADKTQVATDIATAIAPLAIKTEVEEAINLKADASTVQELSKSLDEHKLAADQSIGLKADKTYVDEELAKKANSSTTLNGYGITDAYTKAEVDEALALKATQEAHDALVLIVNDKANTADVYSKTETNEKFAEKATTLEGYGITDTYTKAEANKAIEDALKLATGGESASDVLVALNNYKSENDERVGNAEVRIKALEDAGADDNTIEAIKVAGSNENLAIVDKTVTIPAATLTTYGLVKLSAEIGATEDGALEVKSLNVNKLAQDENDWLILNGGNASI